ncbi:fimbrillin family protein, partial [Bacteroides caecimuris]
MKLHLLGGSCLLALLSACSSGEEEQIKIPEVPVKQIPITLNCVASNASVNADESVHTRITDWGYESQDKIGLYVVNYNGTTPGTLQNNGNHVNNMRFTYGSNGTWSPDKEIFWKDENTQADFYCYFPYATPSDISAHSFSVKEDQSTEQAYKASEFLYGKTSGVAPTEDAVSITTKHIFSCAVINV